MQFNNEKIKREVLQYLIDWERHKHLQLLDQPNEPGKSPLSQSMFASNHWQDYFPGIGGNGLLTESTAYQYVKDANRQETKEFERAIATVFQALERRHVITIAAPYERAGGTTGYGTSLGGTPSNFYELTSRAAQLADLDAEGLLAVLNIPSGYEDMAERVEQFIRSQVIYDRNVFLIMPFGADAELDACRHSLTTFLNAKGYNLFRADETEYEDGLWDNICVYMLGCKYGIAMFREVSGVMYNANVGVEIGFMKALNKRVLILKDAKLPKLPGDLIHNLYHAVDFADTTAVESEAGKWFDDL